MFSSCGSCDDSCGTGSCYSSLCSPGAAKSREDGTRAGHHSRHGKYKKVKKVFYLKNKRYIYEKC